MCTRAFLLVSLVGTVWGCGSLKTPCEDKGHKLNKGEVLKKVVNCNLRPGLYPQIFQGSISTTSDVNLTIYSANRAEKNLDTLVAPTEISNSAWKFPADPSKCDPLYTCYMGKLAHHINVEITCNSKDGCEVDTILSSGCGDSQAPTDCVWTQWTTCTGSGTCYHHRFASRNFNGGSACEGPQSEECTCPGPQPTHSPGYTNPPTPSPTLSPTGPTASPGSSQTPSPTMSPGSTMSPNATESPTHPDTPVPTTSPENVTFSPTAPSSGSSSKVPIIVGASVGGAVVVGAIVGAIIWHLKCRKAKDGERQGLMNEGSGAEGA